MLPLLISLRPKQWIKNVFVLLPLIFSGLFVEIQSELVVFAVFGIFCAAASATYLVNDILDAPADRRHPRKKHRPIAAGRLSETTAIVVAGALMTGALACAWYLGYAVLGLVLAYLVQHLLYSLWLKHIAILDLIVIALGFVLRIYAGAVVIDVPASSWLVALTFLVALLLATGKRLQELQAVGTSKGRKVLDDYSPEFLRQAILVLLPTIFVGYLLYTFQSTQSPLLIMSVPVVAYGVLRYLQILSDENIKTDGPTELLFADRSMQLTVVAWFVIIIGVLVLAN